MLGRPGCQKRRYFGFSDILDMFLKSDAFSDKKLTDIGKLPCPNPTAHCLEPSGAAFSGISARLNGWSNSKFGQTTVGVRAVHQVFLNVVMCRSVLLL